MDSTDTTAASNSQSYLEYFYSFNPFKNQAVGITEQVGPAVGTTEQVDPAVGTTEQEDVEPAPAPATATPATMGGKKKSKKSKKSKKGKKSKTARKSKK